MAKQVGRQAGRRMQQNSFKLHVQIGHQKQDCLELENLDIIYLVSVENTHPVPQRMAAVHADTTQNSRVSWEVHRYSSRCQGNQTVA